MNKTLKVGLPKGSLQETTLKLLKKAGWNFNLSSRAYKPYCDDNELEAWLIRAQERRRPPGIEPGTSGLRAAAPTTRQSELNRGAL